MKGALTKSWGFRYEIEVILDDWGSHPILGKHHFWVSRLWDCDKDDQREC